MRIVRVALANSYAINMYGLDPCTMRNGNGMYVARGTPGM